jgi:hypothetical protein
MRSRLMVERGIYLRGLGIEKKTFLSCISVEQRGDLTPFIKDSGSEPIYNYEGPRSIQVVAWLIPDIQCYRTFRRVRRTRNPGSTIITWHE